MSRPPENRPPWHALLAPLPPEAMPVREEAATLKELVAEIVTRAG